MILKSAGKIRCGASAHIVSVAGSAKDISPGGTTDAVVPEGRKILAGGETTGTMIKHITRPGGAQEIGLILRPSRARNVCVLFQGCRATPLPLANIFRPSGAFDNYQLGELIVITESFLC
jgi:hypothetical protein